MSEATAKKQKGTLTIVEVCSIDKDAMSDKIKISPVGVATGLDRRRFNLDGKKLLEEHEKHGLKLVLNVDHGITSKYGSEAAGWFDDLEEREDGIYASLYKNDLGTELIDSDKYKYLSPEYLMDEYGNPVIIVGVALVNQPNLLNESLNHINPEETAMDEDQKAELEALRKQNEQLQKDKEAQAEQLREIKVDNAINKGELNPSKKEFALALDENAIDGYLKLEANSTSKIEKNNIDKEQNGNDDDPEMDKLLGNVG